jgi:hypothetical protein
MIISALALADGDLVEFLMKKLLLILPALAITVAHADELKTISVPSPIKINKLSQYPDGKTVDKVSAMNLKLHAKGSDFIISYTGDVLKDGKLYTADELASMSDVNQVAAILNSDHCDISDAYALYQHTFSESSLKGDLLLHVYQSKPINVMMTATGTADGSESIVQLLEQEYFVVKPSNHESLLALIRCYTTLQSSNSADAQEKESAYEAAGTYAPLIRQLKQ